MALGLAIGLGVAQTLVAGMAQAEKGLNEARRIKAQNKAKIKQMQNQFELNTQNLHNNNVSIKQNKMRNDIAIEESKLDAQDAFTQAFVGSGIKGRTLDIKSAELQGDVDKAHNRASDVATKESDRQFLGLVRSSDSISSQIDNLESFDVGASESNTNMAMLSAGLNSAGGVIGSL